MARSVTSATYYNEINRYAAQWLRNLMADGLIPDGVVDTRSIVDVHPDDLDGFRHCHFFAGIGGWALALHLARWPADREIWTASCPCQPFSDAGRRAGEDDDRHLWPVVARLLRERRRATIVGEQVASRLGLAWLDGVSADLEAAGYAVGASDLCAASVGAPHIRQRLYWVGDADSARAGRDGRSIPQPQASTGQRDRSHGHGAQVPSALDRRLADDDEPRRERKPTARLRRGASGNDAHGRSPCDGMADATCHGRERREGAAGPPRGGSPARDSSDHEGWHHVELVECREPRGVKHRPLVPGVVPLVDGFPGRVGQVRAYGNAIVPQVAATFLSAFLACRP